MSALLRACESGLRTFLSDPDGKVAGIQPAPGAPPPVFGQWYYAIHAGAVTGDQATNSLSNDKLYAVQVTITAKTAYVPADRKGRVIVSQGDVVDRAEDVADYLHMNYAVLDAANALIPGAGVSVNGFDEHPLLLESITPPSDVAADWTGGDTNPGDVLVSTVTLGGARRVRPLS